MPTRMAPPRKLLLGLIILTLPGFLILRQLSLLHERGLPGVSSELSEIKAQLVQQQTNFAAQNSAISALKTDVESLRKQLRGPSSTQQLARVQRQLDAVLQRISQGGNLSGSVLISEDEDVRVPVLKGPEPPADVYLITGVTSDPEHQKFCKIPSLSLEPEWIEKLSQPNVKEACKSVPKFVKVEDNSLVLEGCSEGEVTAKWVTRDTHNWTSAVIHDKFALPVESGVVQCKERGADKTKWDMWVQFQRNETASAESERKTSKIKQPKPMNVAIFFVDSLAAARFRRELPITYELLQKVQKGERPSHEVFTFNRYNVIKGGTQNNAPALLAGYCYADLPGDDKWVPWLFDVYRDRGYVTSIIEMDSVVGKSSLARIRTKTHSLGNPTDFIGYRARKDEMALADHVLATVFDEVLEQMDDPSLGSFGSASTKLCFGGQYLHTYSLKYMKEFFNAYPNQPKFLYYAPMEVHEPTMKRGITLDQDMADALEALMAVPEDTMIVFMGDHGLGYGPWQTSKVGRLEEKMPALSWIMPKNFLDANPEVRKGLASNFNRLVTAYDQHYTLLQVQQWPEPVKGAPGFGKGRSMFETIPGERTCKEAYIPTEYCSCVEFKDADAVELKSTLFVSLATSAIEEMNSQITALGTTSCVPLELQQVTEAATLMSEVLADDIEGDNMVQLRFQTKGDKSKKLTDETFKVNFYGTFNPSSGIYEIDESLKETFPISKFEVGLNYDDGPEVFEQQGIIAMPRRDADLEKVLWARMYVVEHWDPKVPGSAYMAVRWVRPNGQIYQTSIHTLEENWTSSWQSRTLPLVAKHGGEGIWKVQLIQVKTWDKSVGTTLGTAAETKGVEYGAMLGEREFYLVYNTLDTATGLMQPVPYNIVSKFWSSSDLKRESQYAKHKECADVRAVPDICVCPLP